MNDKPKTTRRSSEEMILAAEQRIVALREKQRADNARKREKILAQIDSLNTKVEKFKTLIQELQKQHDELKDSDA